MEAQLVSDSYGASTESLRILGARSYNSDVQRRRRRYGNREVWRCAHLCDCTSTEQGAAAWLQPTMDMQTIWLGHVEARDEGGTTFLQNEATQSGH